MMGPVLVAIDLEHKDHAGGALACAAALARMEQVPVHLCYVLPYGFYSYVAPYIPQDVVDDTKKRAHADLDAFKTTAHLEGLTVVTHVLQGGVYQQILRLAKDIAAGTIVVNAVRPDQHVSTMGPVAAHVARYAPCKVLLVR